MELSLAPPTLGRVLEELRITGLGVIEEATLELAPGLTVVTGETGAGKTMVVQGLSLLFGGRADSGLVRPGADRAAVEGRLALPAGSPALDRAAEAGAELDDGGALLLVRTVGADGRSRAYAGGRAVPASVLAELAEDTLTVHGQAGSRRLLRPAAQRDALDRYAGAAVATPLLTYRELYDRWRTLAARLERVAVDSVATAAEADRLRAGLAEIEAVGPGDGELAGLLAEIERLDNAEALQRAAGHAHTVLTGDPAEPGTADVVGLLDAARRSLEPLGATDPELATLAVRVRETGYVLADVAADLASYVARTEADPARLAAAQERRAELGRLVRRYAGGGDLDAVLDWAATARDRLADLDLGPEAVERLTVERDALLRQLSSRAEQVSEARRQAAGRFGREVATELAALAMPHAAVTAKIEVQAVAAGRVPALCVGGRDVGFGPHGVDDVELLLAANAGAPPRPLHRGASGGELSRVMLAVEVVLAGDTPAATVVFDEVDAGVGGRAAVEVGKRLAALARRTQVVVVTHLPQVAAFADCHLRVVKTDDGAVTRSGVVRLGDTERVRELSRMLAGVEESVLAHGHAEELLRAAEASKTG